MQKIENSFAFDLNDVNFGNLYSQKDAKDEPFSMKNITFRLEMY